MRKYLLGLVLVISAVSCNKDKDMKKAVVIDTGDITQGGCGYILRLTEDNTELSPMYLDSKYRHNNYKVKVKYNTHGEYFACHSGSVGPDSNRTYILVEIDKIKTDND